MNTHVKVLGVLFLVFGGLSVMTALVLLGIGGMAGAAVASANDPDAVAALPFIGIMGSIAIFVMLGSSLPGIAAGVGLLKFKSWGRILAIVLCAVSLIGFPFGTIFGAYGLWVLLNKETERLFSPVQVTTI